LLSQVFHPRVTASKNAWWFFLLAVELLDHVPGWMTEQRALLLRRITTRTWVRQRRNPMLQQLVAPSALFRAGYL
jgi:hypothetical protein